ncbi:MAG TPA: hypothetical protein VK553_11390 [Candidatus Nitrosopolaris rasttigaisensis]|nr:hypothetical protein [Candidatus Nitrosopolaris rasttigaisensis]
MRIYTKHIEIPEKGDIVYDCDNDIKGEITTEEYEVYEVKYENGDYDEYEFERLTWDSRNNWWEI